MKKGDSLFGALVAVIALQILFYVPVFMYVTDSHRSVGEMEAEIEDLYYNQELLEQLNNELSRENEELKQQDEILQNSVSSLRICIREIYEDNYFEIEEEIEEGEMEMLAQLIEAEAGNQDFKGKCLVADVVLNRVDSSSFPDNIEDVIFEKHKDKHGKWHYQFSTVVDGSYEKAGWNISEDSFKAAEHEYLLWKNRDFHDMAAPTDIVSFTAGYYNPYFKPAFKYGDHYFGTL